MTIRQSTCKQPERVIEVYINVLYVGNSIDIGHISSVDADSEMVKQVQVQWLVDPERVSDEYDTEWLVRTALRENGYDPDRVIEIELLEVMNRRVYVGNAGEPLARVSRSTLSKLLGNTYILGEDQDLDRNGPLLGDAVDEAELALENEIKT